MLGSARLSSAQFGQVASAQVATGYRFQAASNDNDNGDGDGDGSRAGSQTEQTDRVNKLAFVVRVCELARERVATSARRPQNNAYD